MSLAEKVLNGDLTAASRLITDIDDEMDSAIKGENMGSRLDL